MYENKYRKFRTIIRDFFPQAFNPASHNMMQLIYAFFHFSNGRQERSNRKEWDITAYRKVRPMYVWNDFSFKHVLGAAYNQVRFIVRNLRIRLRSEKNWGCFQTKLLPYGLLQQGLDFFSDWKYCVRSFCCPMAESENGPWGIDFLAIFLLVTLKYHEKKKEYFFIPS